MTTSTIVTLVVFSVVVLAALLAVLIHVIRKLNEPTAEELAKDEAERAAIYGKQLEMQREYHQAVWNMTLNED